MFYPLRHNSTIFDQIELKNLKRNNEFGQRKVFVIDEKSNNKSEAFLLIVRPNSLHLVSILKYRILLDHSLLINTFSAINITPVEVFRRVSIDQYMNILFELSDFSDGFFEINAWYINFDGDSIFSVRGLAILETREVHWIYCDFNETAFKRDNLKAWWSPFNNEVWSFLYF